jgi:hypothetical protein
MKRLLIFTVLAPPIALLLSALFLESPWTWQSFEKGIYGVYLFGIVPSFVVGMLDWALRRIPFRWPLTAFVGGTITMGLAFLAYSSFSIPFVIGAIPAAICSWLSGPATKQEEHV